MTTVEQARNEYERQRRRARIIWAAYWATVVGTFIPGWIFMISGYGIAWTILSVMGIFIPVALNFETGGTSKVNRAKLDLLNAEYDEVMKNSLRLPRVK